MKFIQIATLQTIFLLLFTASAFSQIGFPQNNDLITSADVSDEELSLLVKTIYELEPIQIEAQEKMLVAIEAEEITVERFQQMMMASQNPQMADQVNITEEEMEKLVAIQPALMEIQGDADRKMSEKIEENGFTMERYRGIVMGAQQDPELMARIETELDLQEEGQE
ncbi:MAG: DUF4168 domain-containing protein [Balneolaceae bacterium]|nr:MAG: DUF4168 domain-containing protein [Balneolaceae bacterium]